MYSMLGVYCVRSVSIHTYIQYVGCLACRVFSYVYTYIQYVGCLVCTISIHTVRMYSMLGVYCVQSPYTLYVRTYSMLGVYCVQSPYTLYVHTVCWVSSVYNLHTHCTYIQYVGCLLCTVSIHTVRTYSMLGVYCVQSPYTLYVHTICWVSTVYGLHTHCTYIQYVGCL